MAKETSTPGESMGFNQRKTSETGTKTYEGAKAYKRSPHGELFTLVASSLFLGDNTYYEYGGERVERFINLATTLSKEDPEYVASLANYARNELGLRSNPAALVAHLFYSNALEERRDLVLATAKKVWQRGDDHLETLAYVKAVGWKLRSNLKKAIAERLNDIPPSLLLKYKRARRVVSQRLAIKLTHPRPRDEERSLLFQYIVKGSRASEEAKKLAEEVMEDRPTWERIISSKGSTPETWLEALPHLNGLSLVRNLNNLFKHGLLENLEVKKTIEDKFSRSGSWKIFPFQYYSALKMGEKEKWPYWIMALLEEALESSAPETRLEGETLFLVDVSGSMYYPVSKNSNLNTAETASVLATVLVKRLGGELWTFDDRVQDYTGHTHLSTYSLVRKIVREGRGGTYLEKAIRKAILNRNWTGRRVVIITDEQTHDMPWEALKNWLRSGENRVAHIINVAGYLPTAFPEDRIAKVGGWSDKIITLIEALEVGEEGIRNFLVSNYLPPLDKREGEQVE